MSFKKIIVFTSLFTFSHLAFAINDVPPSLNKEEREFTATTTTPPSDNIPTLPNEADDSRNIPQPDVRIIRKKGAVIEEYRVNGHLRFVKITPSIGSPYYMVDTDGDGILETKEDDFSNPPINQWLLLEW